MLNTKVVLVEFIRTWAFHIKNIEIKQVSQKQTFCCVRAVWRMNVGGLTEVS